MNLNLLEIVLICNISGGIFTTFASKGLMGMNIFSNMSKFLCLILGRECSYYPLKFAMKILHSKRIKSLNNGRNYTGTTYVEKEDKEHSQRIRVTDQGEYILRIDFQQDEFDSSEPFCRDISEIISRMDFCIRSSN